MVTTKKFGITIAEVDSVNLEPVYNQAAAWHDAFNGIPEVETQGDTEPPTAPVGGYDGYLYLTASSGCTGAWNGQNGMWALGYQGGWLFATALGADGFDVLFFDVENTTYHRVYDNSGSYEVTSWTP